MKARPKLKRIVLENNTDKVSLNALEQKETTADISCQMSSLCQLKKDNNKRNIYYCRVTTSSQKEDLERQIEYFRCKYPDYEIIKDIGSGLNFKRKG